MRALVAVLALALGACAEDRYRWNLAHAEIHAKPPLSRPDLQEIVRLVSYTTSEPIITISRDSTDHASEQASVLTALETSPGHEYTLRKIASHWRITLVSDVTE